MLIQTTLKFDPDAQAVVEKAELALSSVKGCIGMFTATTVDAGGGCSYVIRPEMLRTQLNNYAYEIARVGNFVLSHQEAFAYILRRMVAEQQISQQCANYEMALRWAGEDVARREAKRSGVALTEQQKADKEKAAVLNSAAGLALDELLESKKRKFVNELVGLPENGIPDATKETEVHDFFKRKLQL